MQEAFNRYTDDPGKVMLPEDTLVRIEAPITESDDRSQIRQSHRLQAGNGFFLMSCFMKYRTVRKTKSAILENGENGHAPFMDFVNDFRRTCDCNLIEQPFALNHDRFDSPPASTIEHPCDEMEVGIPAWAWDASFCREPWFVSGCEDPKPIFTININISIAASLIRFSQTRPAPPRLCLKRSFYP